MKYRITEFRVENSAGEKFFVETGNTYRERFWAFFYVRKINWTLDSGFNTMEEALSKVEEIKKAQPIYHEIK